MVDTKGFIIVHINKPSWWTQRWMMGQVPNYDQSVNNSMSCIESHSAQSEIGMQARFRDLDCDDALLQVVSEIATSAAEL